MNDIHVVTMQQAARIMGTGTPQPVDDFPPLIAELDELDADHRNRASAELAQAVDDGYEIVNVAIGGNERVLLTTWTLRKRTASPIAYGDYTMTVGNELPMIHSAKAVDNATNQLRELFKRWDDRLVLEGNSLSEHYVKGRLKILANLVIMRHGERQECVAILEVSSRYCPSGKQRPIPSKKQEVMDAGYSRYWDQHGVLILDVEVMDSAKRVVPSLVRLQAANYSDDLRVGAIYMSLFDRSFKSLLVRTEREIDIFSIPAIVTNQIASQEVERASKVMDSITDNSRGIFRQVAPSLEDQSAQVGVRVFLEHDAIRVTCYECYNCSVEIVDVLVGTFNL